MPDGRAIVGLLALLVLAALACAGAPRAAMAPRTESRCADDAGWNDPATPRRIYGNTWYVGTCGISALLVTSPRGHVLIDAGTEAAAPQVQANVRALGFRLEDIRAIVTSHAHADHVGGLSRLQQASRAAVYARAPAADVLSTGRVQRSDPQFGVLEPFAAVTGVHIIDDGGHVRVGPIDLVAHATPGHTPGGTSWTWRDCEHGRCIDMAYVDSLSAVSDDVYRYGDDRAHPGYLAAFRATLATVAALRCDVLVTPHPSAGDLWSRLPTRSSRPLVDANACRDYAATAAQRLEQRLAKEAATP